MNRREKETLLLELLEQNQERMRRLCRGYLNDPIEAEDLLQEAIINIWNHLKTFRGEAQLSTWAYRITVNTALMYKRKKGAEEKQKANLPLPDFPSTPSEEEDRESLKQQLHHCIAQLPPADRLLISLFLENLTYKEIATTLGQTTSHVGVRINRVKQKLSKLMKEVSHE